MKITRLTSSCIVLAAMAACGGGSGGGGSSPLPPPPPTTTTYSVALTGVQIERAADQADIDAGELPAEGATVTVE